MQASMEFYLFSPHPPPSLFSSHPANSSVIRSGSKTACSRALNLQGYVGSLLSDLLARRGGLTKLVG